MKARLTKAEFHNIMERLIKKYKKSEEWADKVNDVFPGAFENIYENNFLDIIISFLMFILILCQSGLVIKKLLFQ